MNAVRYTDADFSDRVRQLLSSSSLFDPMVEERTRGILEAVRTRGDDAVLEYTERFDGAKLAAEQLPVMTAELVKASLKVTEALRSAIAIAAKNVEKFSRKGLR